MLSQQYQNESNLKLMFISSNYDGGYTQTAIDTAKSILLSRYKIKELDFKKAWDEENIKLLDLDKKCSLCHNPDVEYSEDIYFCTEENSQINFTKTIPGIISYFTLGVGYISNKISYRYVKIKFKLCNNCLLSHKSIKNNNPKIAWEEYYKHPLYEYYSILGFTGIRYNKE